MTVGLIYLPLLQFFDDAGQPLAGAKLYSYLANSATPSALFADHLGAAPLTNPAIADAGGKLLAWGTAGQAYKLNLTDAQDVQQGGWPIDYVTLTATAPSGGQVLPVGLEITATPVTFLGSTGDAALVGSGGLPGSELILMVQLTVTQQFGTANGAVSLALGDAAITDRWGGALTLTVGVKPLRNGGLPMYPSAQDLILTMEGGTFDGTGAATAVVYSLGLT